MELDGNVRNDSDKIGLKAGEQYPDEDEEDGEAKGGVNTASGGGGSRSENTSVGLRAWQNSSRVCRVSRASGGKDRHSKVYTAKGLRDRRVRLSVSTAIQFYDLQDRLGYDQPSKAVEWLINAAADSIAELPLLNCSFPETPKQLSDEKRPSASEPRFDPTEIELEIEPTPTYQQQQQQHQQHQHISATKSGCSSTSETSKSSVLSLSRNEIRVKARERARERAAKEKEEQSHGAAHQQQDVNQNSQTSFTDLLTDGGIGSNDNGNGAQQTPNFGLKSARPLPSTQMDYFNAGLVGPNSSRIHLSSGFSSQTHFGNPPPPPPFNVTSEQHQELQQFSFLPDHFMPAAGSDYNLNFTISSGLAGFNRGTLQSNSPSPLPHHLQRFSSVDAPNLPFFVGPSASSAPTVENHQFQSGFDARLQLCFGDGYRRSDPKGKGKS